MTQRKVTLALKIMRNTASVVVRAGISSFFDMALTNQQNQNQPSVNI